MRTNAVSDCHGIPWWRVGDWGCAAMSESQKVVRELKSGDVVTLSQLTGCAARRYGKVVKVEKPHRSSGGKQTVIVAVQYLLEPDEHLTVTTADDWVRAIPEA